MFNKPHQIVIVGGGAGGLELATRLGYQLRKERDIQVILVDKQLTHIWKPLWHEVAAGTLLTHEDELSYIAHAYNYYFEFQYGSLLRIDRQNKQIILAEIQANQEQILPERVLTYDTLVIAVGSISHDFHIPGVKECCYTLDSYQSCQDFQQYFLQQLIHLQSQQQGELSIAIIGGGATGVELAAELKFAYEQSLNYKHKAKHSYPIKIDIIESAPRLLAGLPEIVSAKIQQELTQRNIGVLLGEKVTRVTKQAVYTKSGLVLASLIKLWAAGIKAPGFLSSLGLETNARNQLLVYQTLQTTLDKDIFALGDCAACPQDDSGRLVPPRAQAAHQQANLLAQSLIRRLQNKTLLTYTYRDHGSLITLSQRHTLGHLMGNRFLGNILLEGKLARLAYLILYRQHQAALYGWWRVALLILAQFLTKPLRPRLKLH